MRLIPACAGKTGRFSACAAITTAHPRVCGENACTRPPERGRGGSSPRVRGKPVGGEGEAGVPRLIPACAGKTGGDGLDRAADGAHPRVCGENMEPSDSDSTATGSSPRVRGKHPPERSRTMTQRLIPACAGKTPVGINVATPKWAHPRVCGENVRVVLRDLDESGSSPRVRGKPDGLLGPVGARGLIPACAGKTHRRHQRPRGQRAHPRVCGENGDTLETVASQYGSSPRVRGKPPHPLAHADPRGLIPACAGKTASTSTQAATPGAHPRVCGENRPSSEVDGFAWGSSPRVRGKRHPRHVWNDVPRLIPACAGKTVSPGNAPLLFRAHPRVCGENWRRRM